jgi:rhodanese-related sulfurtransferase
MAVRTVRPDEVARLRSQGKTPRIVDVRTPAEYAAVHADGAESMPLDALDPGTAMAGRNGAEAIYFICQSGGRSAKACEKVTAAGFGDAFSFAGGTVAWDRA